MESRKITQEYFDSIVNENINDFGMEPKEAVEDAVNQLKAQGIDLNTICKYPQDEQKELFSAVKRLNRSIKSLNSQEKSIEEIDDDDHDESENQSNEHQNGNKSDLVDQCIKDLDLLKEKFNKDISFRCLATNMKPGPNAYSMFMSYFNKLKCPSKDINEGDSETIKKSDLLISSFINAFQAYISQQNDVIDSTGLRMLIRLTGSDESDEKSGFGEHLIVLQSLLRCITTSCQMNESNRQFYVENGLCENLMKLFNKHKENDSVLCEACILIRSLLLDDDLRVEFGHAHEHAKYIASQLNGIDVLIQIGLGNKNTLSENTLANLMLTLSKLAVRNEYCQEICDKGGLKFVLNCINEDHLKNINLLKSALNLLKSICNNDQVKHEATKSRAIVLLKNVMEKYTANPQICELSCSALTPLLLRNVEACEQFYGEQVQLVMIQILNVHIAKPKLVKQLCLALRNSISRCRHFGEKLIELKLEETLNNLLKENGSQNRDEIKALLRDLGCHVELKEAWAGTGKNLES